MEDPIFSGETAWDALIENYSLDMVEEQKFFDFAKFNNPSALVNARIHFTDPVDKQLAYWQIEKVFGRWMLGIKDDYY